MHLSSGAATAACPHACTSASLQSQWDRDGVESTHHPRDTSGAPAGSGAAAALNDAAQEDNEENVDLLSGNKRFSHKEEKRTIQIRLRFSKNAPAHPEGQPGGAFPRAASRLPG